MTQTRRELLQFAGGAAAGALFTPAPWRLITDTALWSETWPGVPRTARGEIRVKYSNCSLCPAGCPVRARCVGDQPVAMIGAQCPFGLAGHHLPYHPARVRQGPAQEAAAAVAGAMARCKPNERVAVLDLRPGRTVSWTYRRATALLPNGAYLAPQRVLGGDLAVDLAKAKTVISFGVALLDGWGTPARVLALRDGFRLIQVEAVESRTAALADEWIPVRPGEEVAVARKMAAGFRGEGPVLVLDVEERPEILALNQQLGGLGQTIVTRREAPVPDEWKKCVAPGTLADVADGSIRVLLIDESAPGPYIPWSAIERKLVADDPVVVAFGWSPEGYGRHARFHLPTAVYPEAVDDIPPAIDSPAATFRLAAALVPPPAGVVNPAEFVASLASLSAAGALRDRANAIHKSQRGTVTTPADGKSGVLKDMKPDDFWKALNEGATWTDSLPDGREMPRLPSRAAAAPTSEDALPFALVAAEAGGPSSPILSKLYQESNLRLAARRAVLHPADAADCGIADGGNAVLETRCGALPVQVSLDAGTPRGVVQVAAHPMILDLCGSSPRAKVVRA